MKRGEYSTEALSASENQGFRWLYARALLRVEIQQLLAEVLRGAAVLIPVVIGGLTLLHLVWPALPAVGK